MPNNVYSSLIELLRTNSVISPLLGDYKEIKSVFAGTRPEDSNETPTITITGGAVNNKQTNKDDFFTLNLYVNLDPTIGGEVRGRYYQGLIIEELDDKNFTIGGVPMRFTATGLGTFANPVDKEINCPITLRVTNWSC